MCCRCFCDLAWIICIVRSTIYSVYVSSRLVFEREHSFALAFVHQPEMSVSLSTLHVPCSLAFMHERNIVHRDLKTENVLLTLRRQAKLADFGVARTLAADPRNMTGATGTLGYMAPEVSPLSLCFSSQNAPGLKVAAWLPGQGETCRLNVSTPGHHHDDGGLQVLAGRPYNQKADVYSFGICLWEIYFCEKPFPNLDLQEMAAVVNKVCVCLALY